MLIGKQSFLCSESKEGLCHQKRRELNFAYGSGHPHKSFYMCYLTRSLQLSETPLILCIWRTEQSSAQGHSANEGTSFLITWKNGAAELCVAAESRSRALLTSNLHRDFSRQRPNTKHDFWVLYLGLCEGTSRGNKDHVHCVRRKHFFSPESQHLDFHSSAM